MNLFGLHSFAIAPGWDLARVEPQMDRLKEHGVGLLEFPLGRPEAFDARRARALASRYGVDLVPSLWLPRTLDVIENPQDGLDFLEPALRVAAEVGAFGLCGATYGTVGKTTGRAATQREIDGVSRFLERAARAARAIGLKLGIEPCNRYETHLVNRAADAAKIIERIGQENVFVHLDTCHMQLEEESFAAAFETAAPYLGYVQVSEPNRGVPGKGMLDWKAAFKAIVEINYNGPITLECHADPDGLPTVSGTAAYRFDELMDIGFPFLREQASQAGVVLG
jgi:D-psicose/D-tagatose/L-ribulose 3-epimerase